MCYPWRGYFQGTFLIFFWVVFNFVTFLIFFWQLPIGIYTNITTKLALDSHNEYFGIKLIDTGENQWLSVSKSQWRDVATPDIFCTTPILQHFEIWEKCQYCLHTMYKSDRDRREPVVECVHKSVERCHYTYTTQFLPHVQEVLLSLSFPHIS